MQETGWGFLGKRCSGPVVRFDICGICLARAGAVSYTHLRSAKEKSEAYSNAKADAALAFLPVYDNLQRALAAPCSDEAYAKGVEMTMTQLKQVLEKLGITEIEALGQPFDPNLHNAVMHVEDDSVGESTVVEVFQSGFKMGDKVIRFAMVKVAN